jgi:hypothetical protein
LIPNGFLNLLVGDADGLVDGLGLVQDAQHELGDVGAGDRPAAAEVVAVGGAVGAGRWGVGQSWRPDLSGGSAAKETLVKGLAGERPGAAPRRLTATGCKT